jgi:transposase
MDDSATPTPADPRDLIIARQAAAIARLEAHVAALEARIRQLEELLAAATRSSKRQAAPFSKGPPKPNPKPPGRKPGDGYGTKARRAIPQKIDEVHQAPLPDRCPHCGGRAIDLLSVEQQYQSEIVITPLNRQFNVAVGCCCNCQKRVQGRHHLQTSDALGACAAQLGPTAHGLITLLNKDFGLSHGKIGRFFKFFNIPLSRGGSCQSMLRTAGRCLPQYHSILRTIPAAPWIVADETGWRIGGYSAWLHAFVTADVTAYLIDARRGFEASSRIIPWDYIGMLLHDGYPSYLRFYKAKHQTCLAHLLRRAREMLAVARGGAVILPRSVKEILQEALEIRGRRDAGAIKPATAAKHATRLRERMRTLCEGHKRNPANERFAGHLYKNLNHLFEFLRVQGIDATNWRAEQAIRPAVVNRKVWGGSRTQVGAAAQGILMSVLRTGWNKGLDMLAWLANLLTGSSPPIIGTAGG